MATVEPASATRPSGAASAEKMQFGSDLAVEVIRQLGIDYVAINPGASYRGLHDSIVNFGDTGADGNPEIIQCTHEEIAIAVAHGYAKAAGRLMAAAVHDVVGLQHASMAIFNAWCDRQPILVIGGGGPMASELRRPTDWTHTALVQGNLIRDFTKWDDQPASCEAMVESIVRGHRIAMTEPQGPVYVCLDAGLQEETLGEEVPEIAPMLKAAVPGSLPAPARAALGEVAEAVRGARFPVVLAGRGSEASFAALTRLAAEWALAVVDVGTQPNIATTDPMNLSGADQEVLRRADVIVALDVKDLAGTLSENERTARQTTSILSEGARVYSVTLDDYMVRGFSTAYQRLYPMELTVLADTGAALEALGELLGEPGGGLAQRRQEISEWHDRLRANWRDLVAKQAEETPIAWSALTEALRRMLEGEDFVIANGDTHRGWVRRLIPLVSQRQSLGGSGGGGLGYGLGATIGACLAFRDTDKIVVDLQSDGDLMFATGALWTLAHHKLPALIVMNNNRSYYNDEEHQYRLGRFRGRDESRAGIGTQINSPDIDYAKVAEGLGVVGIGPIEDPSALDEALARAKAVVKNERRPVLVDVRTQSR